MLILTDFFVWITSPFAYTLSSHNPPNTQTSLKASTTKDLATILNTFHPIPWHRFNGMGAETRSKVREVPYDAALQRLHPFSLTHQWICGNLMYMVKITRSLLAFPRESILTHPIRTRLGGYAYKSHQPKCYTRRHQLSFSARAVSFWNKLPDTKVQCIVGLVPHDAAERKLAVPVPRSSHIAHFLPQPKPL